MINFKNHSKITEIEIPDKIQLSTNNFYDCFSNMKNLTIINITHPNIVYMQNCFTDCDNLTNYIYQGKKVENLTNTYYNC